MGEGFESPTPNGRGTWKGYPGKGVGFRLLNPETNEPGPEYFLTGGSHELYNAVGGEGGHLGFPTGNFDDRTGVQPFEHGYIYWNSARFKTSQTEPTDAQPFNQPDVPVG